MTEAVDRRRPLLGGKGPRTQALDAAVRDADDLDVHVASCAGRSKREHALPLAPP